MTSLGGKSRVPRLAVPPAPGRQRPAGQVGSGFCTCTAQSSTIPGGSTLTAATSGQAAASDQSFCAANHVVACTIGTWTLTGSVDIQVLELQARCAGGAPSGMDEGGYVFYLYTQTATLVTCGLAKFNKFTDIATQLTGQAAPVNGDVYTLSAIGTTILAKKNGSTILSATDSSITSGYGYGVTVEADNVHPTVVTGCTITTTC